MMRRTTTRLVALAAVLVFAAGACDDGGGSAKKSSDRTRRSSTTSSTAGPTTTPSQPPPTTPGGIASNRLPPIGIGEPAELAPGIVVEVSALRPTQIEGRGPGETSGPGVIGTVTVRNDGSAPFDLGGLVVNAHYADGRPAVPVHRSGDALRGELAPGRSVTGEYAFRIPPSGQTVELTIESNNAPNVVVVRAERP